MALSVILNLTIFTALIYFLYTLQAKHVPFTKRVFAGLGLGVVFGGLLQLY